MAEIRHFRFKELGRGQPKSNSSYSSPSSFSPLLRVDVLCDFSQGPGGALLNPWAPKLPRVSCEELSGAEDGREKLHTHPAPYDAIRGRLFLPNCHHVASLNLYLIFIYLFYWQMIQCYVSHQGLVSGAQLLKGRECIHQCKQAPFGDIGQGPGSWREATCSRLLGMVTSHQSPSPSPSPIWE